MTAAVLTVHLPKGVWASNGGYEYNLTLAAAAFALAGAGAGAWSLDSALAFSDKGALWGVGALLVGMLGCYGAVLNGREQRQPAHPGQGGRPTPA